MWMCSDFAGGAGNPLQWYSRDITSALPCPYQRCPRPLAVFLERNIFIVSKSTYHLYRYDAQTWKCEDLVSMTWLKFQDKGTIVECVFTVDVIPYIPSSGSYLV
jgi:hypothetical protein